MWQGMVIVVVLKAHATAPGKLCDCSLYAWLSTYKPYLSPSLGLSVTFDLFGMYVVRDKIANLSVFMLIISSDIHDFSK